MERGREQQVSTRGWGPSVVAVCVAFPLLVNLFACGDSQQSDQRSSETPTTGAQEPTERSDKPKGRPDKPKARPGKAKGRPDKREGDTAAKQATSQAPRTSKVPAGRDLPSRGGPVGVPGRAVACLKKRGYGQTRTVTGAAPGGGGTKPATSVVTVGPILKSRIGATLLYFDSVTQAKRLGETVSRARTRATIPGAYQVIGRVVIQYMRTPARKVSADIEACIR